MSLAERSATSGRLFRFPPPRRMADMAGALLLLALLSPVMLAIAAAIQLSGPGPVLYRQARHGRRLVIFRCYKFRTMKHDKTPARFRQCGPADARVTRLGAILRRTSLDELPQLFNVLGGSMALVGPRPHPVALDARFRRLIPGYARRYDVKPGMTGLAQIRGLRGPTPTVKSMRRRLAADLEYIEKAGAGQDLRILLATLPAVISRRNAV